MTEPRFCDALILGAGGSGMMCAIEAAKRGRSVVLLDHQAKVGGKILISGGGRCNFTNIGASPAQYVSENPHFCKSALSRYPSQTFIDLVKKYEIPFHEKKLGQLFCDESAQAIVDLLESECAEAGADRVLDCKVLEIQTIQDSESNSARFRIQTSQGCFECHSLVIATGGLSIPKLGATGFGYQVATQFGLRLTPRLPALDGFVFGEKDAADFEGLAGVSVDCTMESGGKSFRENLLFTHSGLSGPASLQASLHWWTGNEVTVNLCPDQSIFEFLMKEKKSGNRAQVRTVLSQLLPSRLSERVTRLYFSSEQPLPEVSEKGLEAFCQRLHAWKFVPKCTVGYSKAEVTRGGVDTQELSSKTMESKKVPGLYFIGEVVDVTGWLGGYNFQWAWASGWAAGQVV